MPWTRRKHVGFGLLGEQGAESIHARFNTLLRTYHSVPDKVQQLVLIVKEHLLSVAPQNVTAILLLPSELSNDMSHVYRVINITGQIKGGF